jgi:hypothetical protein
MSHHGEQYINYFTLKLMKPQGLISQMFVIENQNTDSDKFLLSKWFCIGTSVDFLQAAFGRFCAQFWPKFLQSWFCQPLLSHLKRGECSEC